MKTWQAEGQTYNSVDAIATHLADKYSHNDSQWCCNWIAISTTASNMGHMMENTVYLGGYSVTIRCEYE